MDVRIEDEQFEDWVLEAIDALPQAFRERLGSVAIVVEEWPTAEQLASVGRARAVRALQRRPAQRAGRRLGADAVADHDLPRDDRAARPDARGDARAKVIDTVHHEIAHHFGISDARLRELARERDRHPGRPASAWTPASCSSRTTPSIREITALGLRGAGFEVDDRRRRRRGPGPLAARAAGPRPARRDAAAARRPRGAARDPPRGDDAGRDAHRARPTRSTSSSAWSRAPTTTCASRSRCRSSWRASGRRSGAGARTRATRRTALVRLGPLRIDPAGRTVDPRRRGDRADPHRVRPPRRARPAPGQVVRPRPAARPGLGLRLPRRLAPRRRRRSGGCARRWRPIPPSPQLDPHGPRRGLQGRAAGTPEPTRMRSLRTRLAVTLVLLVTLTVAADRRRRLRVRRRLAARPARRGRPPAGGLQPVGAAAGDRSRRRPTPRRSRRAACPTQFRLRGDAEVIADFGDGIPWAPAPPPGRPRRRLAGRCATIVGAGRARLRVADGRRRAGPRRRRAPGGAARRCTSCSRRRAVEEALAQLRLGLLAGGLLAILARARHVRAHRPRHPPAGRPPAARRRAADRGRRPRRPRPDRRPRRVGPLGRGVQPDGRLARGDRRAARGARSARTAGSSRTCRTSSGRRSPRSSRRRRCSRARSTGCRRTRGGPRELLVADVRRLRTLVDDLMEISRFDAAAEQPSLQAIDLGRRRDGGRRGAPPGRGRRPAGAAGRRGVRPAPARPDPRQPPRQRPRPRARARPVEVSLTPVAGGAVVVVADRGPGVAARRAAAPVRPLLQGRPVARSDGGRPPAWASRSRPSTRRCSAAACGRANRPGGGLIVALTLPVTRSLPASDGADTRGGTRLGAYRNPHRGTGS